MVRQTSREGAPPCIYRTEGGLTHHLPFPLGVEPLEVFHVDGGAIPRGGLLSG